MFSDKVYKAEEYCMYFPLCKPQSGGKRSALRPPTIYSEFPQKVRAMVMYQLRNIQGHIQVYDWKGNFLFSADSEREAREELKDYAESAA